MPSEEYYIYQAAHLCQKDGEAVRKALTKEGLAPEDPDDERTYDSDDFPKGPYLAESEEIDAPSHCDFHEQCRMAEKLPSGRKIGAFIPFSLTEDGIQYVRQAYLEDPDNEVVQFWVDEYESMGYDLDLPGVDPEGSYAITIDFFGEDISSIPAHAGELHDVDETEWGAFVTFGAGGWELKDVLEQLIANDDVGDSITIVDMEDNGIVADDWQEAREFAGIQ